MATQQQIDQFLDMAHRVGAAGLTICSSGNISWRLGDEEDSEVLMSATGSWVPQLTADKVSVCRLSDGAVLNGVRPSIESRFHLGVMRLRPEVRCVLHYQSPYATAVACMDKRPKNFNVTAEVPIYVGETIPEVPYLLPGSEALAHKVIEALTHHNTAFMLKHGQVVCGESFDQAFERAMFLEQACRIVMLTGDRCDCLDEAQLEEIRQLIASKSAKG